MQLGLRAENSEAGTVGASINTNIVVPYSGKCGYLLKDAQNDIGNYLLLHRWFMYTAGAEEQMSSMIASFKPFCGYPLWPSIARPRINKSKQHWHHAQEVGTLETGELPRALLCVLLLA